MLFKNFINNLFNKNNVEAIQSINIQEMHDNILKSGNLQKDKNIMRDFYVKIIENFFDKNLKPYKFLLNTDSIYLSFEIKIKDFRDQLFLYMQKNKLKFNIFDFENISKNIHSLGHIRLDNNIYYKYKNLQDFNYIIYLDSIGEDKIIVNIDFNNIDSAKKYKNLVKCLELDITKEHFDEIIQEINTVNKSLSDLQKKKEFFDEFVDEFNLHFL